MTSKNSLRAALCTLVIAALCGVAGIAAAQDPARPLGSQEGKEPAVVLVPGVTVLGNHGQTPVRRAELEAGVEAAVAKAVATFQGKGPGMQPLHGEAMRTVATAAEVDPRGYCDASQSNQRVRYAGADMVLCVKLIDMGASGRYWASMRLYGPLIESNALIHEAVLAENWRDEERLHAELAREVSTLLSRVEEPRALPKLNITARNTAELGTLIVQSDPEGASVQINGRSLGITPFERLLPAGRHSISVTYSGHDSASRVVEIQPGVHTPWRPRLKPLGVRVTLSTLPGDATVYAEGKYIGVTPLDRVNVPKSATGPLRLDLIKSGYITRSITFDARYGDHVVDTVVLTPMAEALSVYTPEAGTLVEIDGHRTVTIERSGVSTLQDIGPGTHLLRVRRPGRLAFQHMTVTMPFEGVYDLTEQLGSNDRSDPNDVWSAPGRAQQRPPGISGGAPPYSEPIGRARLGLDLGAGSAVERSHVGLGLSIDLPLGDDTIDPWADGWFVGGRLEGLSNDTVRYNFTDDLALDWMIRAKALGGYVTTWRDLEFALQTGPGVVGLNNALLWSVQPRASWRMATNTLLDVRVAYDPTLWSDQVVWSSWAASIGLARRF